MNITSRYLIAIFFFLCALSYSVECQNKRALPQKRRHSTAKTSIQNQDKNADEARAAIKALHKLAIAIEVGINFHEYTSKLIDTKAEVEEKTNSLPNEELKKEILLAMDAFIDAKLIWDRENEFYRKYPTLVDVGTVGFDKTDEQGLSILKKYSISLGDAEDKVYANRSKLIPSIWKAARLHIDKATSLLK